MTYYLYKSDEGRPNLTDYELLLEFFPGYELVESGDGEPPIVSGMKFDESNQLVPAYTEPPEYVLRRATSYPSLGDQMDMLWHAMDDGLIPKIEPLYSDIKAVKDKHPKPESQA